ncbi:MAG: nitroreductase family deazaflavin-dependent oxidoreductase [Microbacteriaceae bacterium]|nr:nitroreductase family deazaflavin-dependent oxidoreductase [Microbacteriaceae bacterium]
MTSAPSAPPRVPPRWFVRTAWAVHRAVYRITGGRKGLSAPEPGSYGMLRLRTTGRRSGAERAAILAYYEEGERIVLIAMNGWAEGHPAWWLNLQAEPHAVVDLPGGEERAVVAREALGEERTRLWDGFAAYTRGPGLGEHAARRETPTPVVVLEPAAG